MEVEEHEVVNLATANVSCSQDLKSVSDNTGYSNRHRRGSSVSSIPKPSSARQTNQNIRPGPSGLYTTEQRLLWEQDQAGGVDKVDQRMFKLKEQLILEKQRGIYDYVQLNTKVFSVWLVVALVHLIKRIPEFPADDQVDHSTDPALKSLN